MELIELKSNIRTAVGKGPARVLRRDKHIPAVLYGPETESVLLSVSINDLNQALKKTGIGQILLNLVVQNGESYTKTAMIKELQVHPVSGNFIHIDFYEISMDRKINIMIPVVIKGKSKGVELGGTLQTVRHELEVLCLPLNIPESFEVDITDLDIGDSLHIRDISPGGGVEFLEEPDLTVVTILSPALEEVPSAEEEEEAEALAAEEASTETEEE